MLDQPKKFKEVVIEKTVACKIAEIIRARKPKVIAITGPSNSGKSTLAKKIAEELGESRAIFIHLVDYWLYSRDEMKKKGITGYDWEARDKAKIINDISKLKKGEDIKKPIQDRDKEVPSKNTETIEAKEYIIIEAALDFKDIADLIIFTHAPDEILIERRKVRDGMKTAFDKSPEKVETYMRETSLPDFRKKLEPLKSEADIIIDTNTNQIYIAA